VEGLNTANVTDMAFMFDDCSSLCQHPSWYNSMVQY